MQDAREREWERHVSHLDQAVMRIPPSRNEQDAPDNDDGRKNETRSDLSDTLAQTSVGRGRGELDTAACGKKWRQSQTRCKSHLPSRSAATHV